jgi:hypothetical protein
MSHSIGTLARCHGPRIAACQPRIRCRRHRRSAATSAKPAAESRLLTGHGAEIAVDAPEQIDQDFPLVLSQACEQPALALKCRDDNGVMGLLSFRRQRNRVAPAVARIGLDRDQVALLHHGQGAAHRALIEADDVTNARGGDARLDCEQRHDSPLGDVDTEPLLVERRGAARKLVGDERDEGGHVALEIKRLACLGAARSRLLSGRVGRCILAHVSHHPRKLAVEK